MHGKVAETLAALYANDLDQVVRWSWNCGLSRALTGVEDPEEIKRAIEPAMGLVNSLAEQLEDPALKVSFLASILVREIKNSRI